MGAAFSSKKKKDKKRMKSRDSISLRPSFPTPTRGNTPKATEAPEQLRTRPNNTEHMYDDLRRNDDYENDTSNAFQQSEMYNVTKEEPTEEDLAIKKLKREIAELDAKTTKQKEIGRLKALKREKLAECLKIESENNKLTIKRRPNMDHVTQTTTGEEIVQRRYKLESMQKEADDKKNVLRLEVKHQVLTKEISQIDADIQNVQVVDNGIAADSGPVEVDIDTARQYIHSENYHTRSLRQPMQNLTDQYQYATQTNLTRNTFMDSGVFSQSTDDLNY